MPKPLRGPPARFLVNFGSASGSASGMTATAINPDAGPGEYRLAS